jgi:hypothetical protein
MMLLWEGLSPVALGHRSPSQNCKEKQEKREKKKQEDDFE